MIFHYGVRLFSMLYLLQYSNIADINIIESIKVPCGRGGALLLRDVAGAVRGGARHCLGRSGDPPNTN